MKCIELNHYFKQEDVDELNIKLDIINEKIRDNPHITYSDIAKVRRLDEKANILKNKIKSAYDYSEYSDKELKDLKVSIRKNVNWKLKDVQAGGMVEKHIEAINRELSKRGI